MNFSSIPFVASATPGGAPPADPSWRAPGAQYATISALTAHPVAVPAGLAVGDWLVLLHWEYGTVTSVVASNSQALTQIATGGLGKIWAVQVAGTIPTSVTVNLSAGNDFTAQAFAGINATAIGGVVQDANSGGTPRTEISYEADAVKSLIISLIAGNGTGVIDTATFNGADAADYLERWDFTNYNVVLGVHDGTTGAKTYGVTWDPADSGTGGSWHSVELVP